MAIKSKVPIIHLMEKHIHPSKQVNKTRNKIKKNLDALPVSQYSMNEAIAEGRDLFLQSMRKLEECDILHSKVLPGVSAARLTIQLLIEQVDTVKEEIVSIIKLLWPSIIAGDSKYTSCSRREAVFSSFHKARLSPALQDQVQAICSKTTKGHTSSVIQTTITRAFFESLLLRREKVEKAADDDTNLMMDKTEENVLRYACGYVPMALSRQLQRRGAAFHTMVEVLSAMRTTKEQAPTFLSYTTEWISRENRGGLYVVNDKTYLFFRRVEHFVRLNQGTLIYQNQSLKQIVIDSILADRVALSYWSDLCSSLTDNSALELLNMCIKLWVNIRGHSTARQIIEEYRLAELKSKRSKKGIRKELKECQKKE
ncbi:uncharacterized protein [Ptychodera flava]|uniref:uncharacterized protein n=1 Tax=Ptychodera flava TaxID=63121 RepID=UPI00396A4A46